MKAVLTNRIYLSITEDLYKDLRKTLTYQVTNSQRPEPIKITDVTRCSPGIATIPIGRTDLIPEGYEIVDKRNTVRPTNRFVSSQKLRVSQQAIINELNDSCIIVAKVGYGKTFTALHAIEKLQQKTLVCVHSTMLRDQWVEEVKKVFGIEAGVVGSGKREYESDIVIGTIQTLSKDTDKIKNMFGCVICDEAHHVPAKVFKDLIDKLNARYKIALTGTLFRRDGLEAQIPDYFGTKIFEPPEENVLVPKVSIINTTVKLSANPMVHWANKINSILGNEVYVNTCCTILQSCLHNRRKVLFVSDRIFFLEDMHKRFQEHSILITGSTGDRDSLVSAFLTSDKSIIFGSLSIFKEGISINRLDTLVLGTVISDKNTGLLEQVIGRIIRNHPDKKQPLVYDIALDGQLGKSHANGRKRLYIDKGWKITEVS